MPSKHGDNSRSGVGDSSLALVDDGSRSSVDDSYLAPVGRTRDYSIAKY